MPSRKLIVYIYVPHLSLVIIIFTNFKTVCHTPNIVLVARVEHSDDDSLICEVTLDNESINEHLTYKWYENETEIPQETHKQLQQWQSVFMSKKYKCFVVYESGNIRLESTSNTFSPTVTRKSKYDSGGANIIIALVSYSTPNYWLSLTILWLKV